DRVLVRDVDPGDPGRLVGVHFLRQAPGQLDRLDLGAERTAEYALDKAFDSTLEVAQDADRELPSQTGVRFSELEKPLKSYGRAMRRPTASRPPSAAGAAATPALSGSAAPRCGGRSSSRSSESSIAVPSSSSVGRCEPRDCSAASIVAVSPRGRSGRTRRSGRGRAPIARAVAAGLDRRLGLTPPQHSYSVSASA